MSWEKFERRRHMLFPSFLPRAFHWNGITGFQNSLQLRQLNSKLELFHSLFVYRAKSWYTVLVGEKKKKQKNRKEEKAEKGAVQAMALAARAGVLLLVCLVLRFWPVVPFIVSRENLRLVFYVSVFYIQVRTLGSKWLWAAISTKGIPPSPSLSAWVRW